VTTTTGTKLEPSPPKFMASIIDGFNYLAYRLSPKNQTMGIWILILLILIIDYFTIRKLTGWVDNIRIIK